MFMFDVETLGVGSDAVVLSMACIHFDPRTNPTYKELKESAFFVKMDAKDQVNRLGRKVDKSTIEWWGKQCLNVKTKSLTPCKDDILVGTPVANRNKEAVRETMGYFAGMVPLRGQIDGQQSFAQHLQTVSARALDCFAQALPFAELAALQTETHRPGAHTIFDIRFAKSSGPGCECAAYLYETTHALDRHRTL